MVAEGGPVLNSPYISFRLGTQAHPSTPGVSLGLSTSAHLLPATWVTLRSTEASI